MVKCCPTCGQEIRSDIDLGIPLSAGNRQIVNEVYKAGENGIMSDRLFNKLYDDDPNGGPSSGMKTLHTRICLLNRKIEPIGWCIRGETTGARVNGRYFFKKFKNQP
jgi:hypothetical protein